ncbi:phytanoyl-CoA dioxygenase family protein [Pseudomonas putida]|uniref:phytanoyl-CoA dioxygenase family protein n=1 Tax=Pseudomonas putida TaxID=303 RepID=UPI001CD38525|nr:phytanoyl-CoA dioxygenase family protein [Pseudomonas putida]
MSTNTMTFASHGYLVTPILVTDQELAFARVLINQLVGRFRIGEPAAVSVGVNISDVSRQYPQRNPDINPDQWKHEPFIIGDLIALEPRFARILSLPSVWACVAELLECAPCEVLFHFCNLTCKPAEIGPAVGWHRDADNRYFASHDGRTVRLLIPLQLMSAHNGGTSVVSGSHLHTDPTIEAAMCPEVPPGAGLALHSAVLHGSSPNRSKQERDVIVIQFGLRSSTLRYQAKEFLSLSTREELLLYYRDSIAKQNMQP